LVVWLNAVTIYTIYRVELKPHWNCLNTSLEITEYFIKPEN